MDCTVTAHGRKRDVKGRRVRCKHGREGMGSGYTGGEGSYIGDLGEGEVHGIRRGKGAE